MRFPKCLPAPVLAFSLAGCLLPRLLAAPTPPASPQERANAAVAAFAQAPSPVAKLVALYRVEEETPFLPTSQVSQLWTHLAQMARDHPLLAAEISAQQARTEIRAGNPAAAAAIWKALGEVENWRVVGPFDNSSPDAITKEEGPEKAVVLTAHYTGKQREVSWRPIPYVAPQGELMLDAYLKPSQSVSAYLVSWVRSPQAQPVALRLRDDGSTRVWVNGKLVFDEEGAHSSQGFDQHGVGAELAAGWNEILVKSGDTGAGGWQFALRITTPEGKPLPMESRDLAPVDGPERAAAAAGPAPSVADLTAMAHAAAGTPQGELDYAWVLNRKHNFNEGGHDDANAFMAAIAGLPNDDQAVLDFTEHDNDQSRIYQNLEQLLSRDPGNARAHMLLGYIELGRSEYWPARSDFAAALGMTAVNAPPPADALKRLPMAGLGMMEAYGGMRLQPEARVWARALADAGEQYPSVAQPVATMLLGFSAVQAAQAWLAQAHQQDLGGAGIGLALASVQRRTGDFTGSLATLRQVEANNGELPELLDGEARALAGLGRGVEAEAKMRQAVSLSPDDPTLRIAQGEIDRLFGHNAAAVSAWQQALNLNPQDSDLRDRLRLARGGESALEASFERPYTQTFADVVAAYKARPAGARAALESGPVVVLSDVSVTNIFPSGNSGRYEQQIFRVNNQQGADSLAYYAVTYDPAVEQVRFLTARVVHPDGTSADAPEAGDQTFSQSVGYETYYDVRNKFVQMPAMRPGDFVEIAYRVLPTTLESLYGDYYGSIDQFGSPAPTLYQEYVVITPASKTLFSKPVRFQGQTGSAVSGGNRIYRWSARDLPAQVGEPNAPPAIEQAPYIEVSAFQNWSDFAHWYTRLIRDTFVMNDEMVQTVAGLVKGKTSERDKVDAIYRWVIQNTHYVALEFGIHGYRPYPVTEVFHRRFGDCKDKASLLIAMLHQAGIRSDFVLVRVRELGLVDPAIPSVADFDHAIVYVPDLKLYLDGTAEYEGAHELPEGDQRAFVLRIPVDADLAADPAPGQAVPTSASTVAAAPMAPVVTPEQPPATNVDSRVLNGQIDAQGNLHFQMSWIVQGGQAPVFRQALQLPDRQAGALQAMLHDQLPGISILHAGVENENDWDQPIEMNLEGVIPGFAGVSGKTLLLPRQILPYQWLPHVASLAQRQYDVLMPPPQILQEEMHLALPPGYQPQIPPPTQMDQPFASFQADVNLNGNTLTLRSRVETKQSLISPATYPAFRTFWSAVDVVLGRAVTLAPVTPTPAPPGGAQ